MSKPTITVRRGQSVPCRILAGSKRSYTLDGELPPGQYTVSTIESEDEQGPYRVLWGERGGYRVGLGALS